MTLKEALYLKMYEKAMDKLPSLELSAVFGKDNEELGETLKKLHNAAVNSIDLTLIRSIGGYGLEKT